MKKLMTSLFFIIFILSLFASNAMSNDKDEKALAAAKKFKTGKNLAMIGMYYMNISDDDSAEIGFDDYDVYLATKGLSSTTIKVWLLNISKKVISVNPLNFKAVTKLGQTIPLSVYTFQTRTPFQATDLEPNTETEGFVVFLLKRQDRITKLIYDDKLGSRVSRDMSDMDILGFYERELKNIGVD